MLLTVKASESDDSKASEDLGLSRFQVYLDIQRDAKIWISNFEAPCFGLVQRKNFKEIHGKSKAIDRL